MKNKNISLIIIGVVVLVLLIWFVGAYNGLVKKEQNIKGQWAQVETQYQRRMDLIPNLVNSVKGYTQFEAELLRYITELRSQWGNSQTETEKMGVANDMDSALSRLLVLYENYPELQSISAVVSLMDELAGTENRISVERKRYNDEVRAYNVAIKTFPGSMVASMAGFIEKPYFESQEDADTAPVVQI